MGRRTKQGEQAPTEWRRGIGIAHTKTLFRSNLKVIDDSSGELAKFLLNPSSRPEHKQEMGSRKQRQGLKKKYRGTLPIYT